MQVIPVLDLLDGHAVRAVRGERSRYRPIQSSLCATSDPLDVAQALLAATGARTLYVADLGAILQRGAHADVHSALSDALGEGASIWLDAGFTDFASMHTLFGRIARATHQENRAALVPVFGTETLRDPGAIAEARDAGYDPILSLDYHGGKSLGALMPDDCAWWPRRVIVMTLDRVGAAAGPDLDTFASLVKQSPEREFIGAGGIRHDDDLAIAARSGASAWLVASAIHDGSLRHVR
jgi:phosphoribosylformimino-5-aminoimidazole carboxamide ribotide isomerase